MIRARGFFERRKEVCTRFGVPVSQNEQKIVSFFVMKLTSLL